MNPFALKASAYLKAIVSALVAGLALVSGALTDGGLSAAELVSAIGAALAAFVATYYAPNSSAPAAVDPEPDAGYVEAGLLRTLWTIFLVLAIIVLLVYLF